MSVEPFASAWKNTGLLPIVTLWLLGVITTEVTPVIATVTVVVPEHEEQPPELAEMVAEPVFTAVTWPEVCPTETVPASLEDHVTSLFRVF
jgi:hypothetical protein